jgi:pyruvate-ferredoxin/flavodoxin oxidoreductase
VRRHRLTPRFGSKPIKSTYLVNKANFVACHNPSYIDKYDMVSDLKPGGTFLLACGWDLEEIEKKMPGYAKKYIADNNISFYTIDAVSIAREIGLGNRLNTILQYAFFKLAIIIPIDDGVKYMKDAATATYGKRGDAVIRMNHAAIDRGVTDIKKSRFPRPGRTPRARLFTPVATGDRKDLVDFVNNVAIPANAQMGDSLPVSVFTGREDGTFPSGTSAYEKRGIAVDVPSWIPENCIQCGFCSFVCPHAVIRPVVLNEAQAKAAPEGMKMTPAIGLAGYQFALTVSALDCTGCGNCANVCPGKKGAKALEMKPLDTQLAEQDKFAYGASVEMDTAVFEKFKVSTVKGSQFRQPLFEFSGACAGCGETPYAKLVTQLFGDRMYIANATGCSSIWGGSAPSFPYTVNKKGQGPAWANSLFEDNAEYGLGMFLGQKVVRDRLIENVKTLAAKTAYSALKTAAEAYLASTNDAASNAPATDALVAALGACSDPLCADILKEKDYLSKKSIWIFGGDGWAYDIGYGGLDHVLATGENVNIFVFDTEVYSNTGGQSSKATQTGAVAQFAAAGKEVKKKDLAAISMSYGYIYVAQVAMGADYNQCVKAIAEAEAYDGPSIIIAYAPCFNHGIKSGRSTAQDEFKKRWPQRYWHMFRFDPRLTLEGKNPFQLIRRRHRRLRDVPCNEVRYSALERTFPDRAHELFAKAAETQRPNTKPSSREPRVSLPYSSAPLFG